MRDEVSHAQGKTGLGGEQFDDAAGTDEVRGRVASVEQSQGAARVVDLSDQRGRELFVMAGIGVLGLVAFEGLLQPFSKFLQAGCMVSGRGRRRSVSW